MTHLRPVAALMVVAASAVGAPAADSSPAEAPFAPVDFALVSSLDAREDALAAAMSGRVESARTHDPARMFLLSLAVPGAGQLVQGHWRGYLYLAAELGLWYGFSVLDRDGRLERDRYEAYADAHWDYDAYWAWYCAECADTSAGYECRPLAEYGTQEYYEDIGKYDTYWRWWNPDGDEGDIEWSDWSDADEAARNAYWAMREDSNRDLRHARYSMMAAFLNHVVAAVDSFLSARGAAEQEAGGAKVGLEFAAPETGDGLSCAIVARY